MLFLAFFCWTWSPFFTHRRKRFYTVVLWSRLFMVLVGESSLPELVQEDEYEAQHVCAACQVLRIISFSVTQLPGSSFHCRAGQASATREWPLFWYEHLIVDVRRQVSKSCGDLIFSSHTIFTLTGERRECVKWIMHRRFSLCCLLFLDLISSPV